FFSSRRRHTRSKRDWSSDVCSSDLIDEEYDITDKENAYELKDVRGEISFNDVKFKYNEADELVLNGIDMNIDVGKTVAFVGMSGGGKSSLFSLIMRFYEVTHGNIIVLDS